MWVICLFILTIQLCVSATVSNQPPITVFIDTSVNKIQFHPLAKKSNSQRKKMAGLI